MNNTMEFVRKMPLPQEIKRDYPTDHALQAVKETRDREISDVLTGKDSRLLLIIGPCSAEAARPGSPDIRHRGIPGCTVRTGRQIPRGRT